MQSEENLWKTYLATHISSQHNVDRLDNEQPESIVVKLCFDKSVLSHYFTVFNVLFNLVLTLNRKHSLRIQVINICLLNVRLVGIFDT
jgi:hypothetical protein